MLFMDCWSLFILEVEKKEVMVLDPTETDPANEMKIKHEALAKRFQYRFCNRFKDMFGAGLVETRDYWVDLYLPISCATRTLYEVSLSRNNL